MVSSDQADETSTSEADKTLTCSFCGKPSNKVKKLVSGASANICNECILLSLEAIRSKGTDEKFTFTHQLLNWHFDQLQNEEIVTSARNFPARVRADLQLAVNSIFDQWHPIRFVGVDGGYSQGLNFPDLLDRGQGAKRISPLQYEDVDVGENDPIKCLINGLWLFEKDDVRIAVLLAHHKDHFGSSSIKITFASPAGEAGAVISQQFFRSLEQAVNQSKSYRGKVLSLEQGGWYHGLARGIAVHKIRDVSRDEIILPAKTLDLIERNIVAFAQKRARLKAMNLSGKKGLLFYGPPGTGKTHTVHYLAKHLPDHTTLLVTADQMPLIKEYFLLARLLQPVILVIEDVDLIARDREKMGSATEEVLLNTLLNEMDGLKEDAEIFFILTTNRPEALEKALAARPGRIDQAIEFPLPDHDGREKLVRLYSAGLELDDKTVTSISDRTEGVSASFIKELMRRAAQYYLDETKPMGGLTVENIDNALQEMLFSGGRLNIKILGGNESQAEQ